MGRPGAPYGSYAANAVGRRTTARGNRPRREMQADVLRIENQQLLKGLHEGAAI